MRSGESFVFKGQNNAAGAAALEKMKVYFIKEVGDLHIAKIFKCHHTTVRYWRAKFGFPSSSKILKEKRKQIKKAKEALELANLMPAKLNKTDKPVDYCTAPSHRAPTCYKDFLKIASAKAPEMWKPFYQRRIQSHIHDLKETFV
jgi:hypothetical protein